MLIRSELRRRDVMCRDAHHINQPHLAARIKTYELQVLEGDSCRLQEVIPREQIDEARRRVAGLWMIEEGVVEGVRVAHAHPAADEVLLNDGVVRRHWMGVVLGVW